MDVWGVFLKGCRDFLLKPHCLSCGRVCQRDLCRDCKRQLLDCRYPRPDEDWRGSLPVFAWGQYRPPLKQAIARLKYQNCPDLARPLGNWLGEAWLEHPPSRQMPPPLVVPVPIHPDRQAERGFNQAELIAQAFCHRTRLPLQSQGLVRQRATTAQHQLGAQARRQNLDQAFALSDHWQRRPPRQPLLLLDDIYTTGATARAIASLLQRHQMSVRGIVAIARPLTHPHPKSP